jgi:hypothetical protein
VGVALAAVGTVLIAPASASVAADPSAPWDLVYGATQASGTVRWHQRSVDIAGGPAHVIVCLQDGADDWLVCEQYDRP